MKQVLLIGLGYFGRMVAKQLDVLGHEVMVVDRHEDRVNEILPYVTSAQIGDSTSEAFLKSLGVNNFDVCIVAIGENFQSSLETTSLLKELGAKMVVARAHSEPQEKFLLRNGADEVVNPEKQNAVWTARRFTTDHILDYIKLDNEHAIFEVSIPKNWLGKTLKEVDVRKNHEINILAFKKNGKMILTFSPDDIFENGSTLLVLGSHKAIQKTFRD